MRRCGVGECNPGKARRDFEAMGILTHVSGCMDLFLNESSLSLITLNLRSCQSQQLIYNREDLWENCNTILTFKSRFDEASYHISETHVTKN
ncbi:uncharacterized protein AAES06_012714 isoform 2-T15 [Glossophaga mutica]